MVSNAKISANRCNAKKSTGPKSSGGLKRSSANALKHGLTAREFATRGENPNEFLRFRKQLVREWRPEGSTEMAEVYILAQNLWHLRRGHRSMTELLDLEMAELYAPELSKLIREKAAKLHAYTQPGKVLNKSETTDEKRLREYVESLLETQRSLQSTRLWNSCGVGMALSRLGPREQKLATLLRYIAHFERAADRTMRSLLHLQAQRGAKAEKAMNSPVLSDGLDRGDTDASSRDRSLGHKRIEYPGRRFPH